MNNLSELRLREQLLAFVADPAGHDGRVSELFGARFPVEVTLLHAGVQERHIEAIQGRLAASSNGHVPSWLHAFLRLPSRPAPPALVHWQWAAAFVAALVVLVLLALNLFGPRTTNPIVVVPPGPVKPGPLKPNAPPLKGPLVKIEERPVPIGTPKDRVVERRATPPRTGPGGLVVAKVEVGKFGDDIMGEPTWSLSGEKTLHKVHPNEPLYAGATIETGDMDKAEIVFPDGTTVGMDYNTSVLVPSTGLEPGALRPEEIIVTSGRVSVVAVHAEDSAPFSVKTPVATATVVGTRFTLALKRTGTVQKELKATLLVEEGRVEFSNRLGSVIADGHTESSATARSAPTRPKRIPVLSYWRPTWSRITTVVYSNRLNAASATYKVVYPVGWTGVGVIGAPGEGVRVASVHEESQSKLKVGDHIVTLDGRAVLTADEVRLAFVQRRETPYHLEVERQGERISISFEKKQHKFGGVDVPADLEQALYNGTWPVLTGDPDRAIELLDALTKRTRSAAGFNNLGVAYEMQDEMGMAIRNYKLAVKEAPRGGLYRSNLAGALLKIGNFGRAVEEFSEGLSLAPGLWELFDGQAHALEASQQYPELLAFVESNMARFKQYASYWVTLGHALHRNGRSDEALKALETASGINPSSWEPYHALGLVHYGLGRLMEAERAYRRALEIAPYLDMTLENLGMLLNSMGRYAEAAEVGRRAIAGNPKSSTAFAVLGEALMKLGNWPDSEPAFLRAIELDPDGAMPHGNYGVLLGRMGRFAEAETQLRTAIRLGPPTPDAHLTLGTIFRQTGRFAEAETETRKAIALYPQWAMAHNNLGNILQDAGRPEEAEAEHRTAILLDPQFAHAHNSLGGLLAAAGRSAEAETEYRKAISLDPSDAVAQRNLGLLLLNTGRNLEAEAEYRKAILLDPQYTGAYVSLGLVLHRMGRLAEAEAQYRAAIRLGPPTPKAHNNLGAVLAEAGRHEEAEKEYRKAIALYPSYASPHGNLGLLLLNTGRNLETETETRKAIALDPQYTVAYVNLGVALYRMGRLAEAEAQFRAAIRLDPQNTDGYANLGYVLRRVGRLTEAEAAFRRALELAPKAQTYIVLAQTIEAQGRLPDAEPVYRALLDHAPNDASALNNLAWHLAVRGVKLDEALDLALRAVLAAPEDGGILDTLGWVHFKRGEYDQAEQHLAKAIERYGKSPGVAEVWVHLGAVYEKKNEIDKAKDAYRNALSLQPQNKEAAEALKRLGQ